MYCCVQGYAGVSIIIIGRFIRCYGHCCVGSYPQEPYSSNGYGNIFHFARTWTRFYAPDLARTNKESVFVPEVSAYDDILFLLMLSRGTFPFLWNQTTLAKEMSRVCLTVVDDYGLVSSTF